ncbi:MAG: helix-turn-helix transcriptional regulator [Treponema sp.]|nr:helix-turn-helix transcriptional regulator [Candidatus Treponema equi]
MNLQEIFISNLKKFRKVKNITQEKLAELCETETAYIGQIETNRRFPSINLIEKISAALNVEPYLLFKPEECEDDNKIAEISNKIMKAMETDIKKVLSEEL